jgi:hypothetical protein
MLMTDLAFLVIDLGLAIIFMILTFIYKGIKWLAFIPAILWLLAGLFTINRPNVFTYQGYFTLLFFGLALTMLFMPWIIKESPIEDVESDQEAGSVWDEENEDYANLYEKVHGKKRKKSEK